MGPSFILRGRQIVVPSGPIQGSVLIRDGKITDIITTDNLPRDVPVVDTHDLVIMPGIVDTHTHINEPGRTEWEGFDTATRGAAAGGLTTVIDMPLNSIPATTNVVALNVKMREAEEHCRVDYGFWGGVVPGNAEELQGMVEAGALGFKAFLIDSGVEEFPFCKEEDLRKAMPILAKAGVPLLVHAELEGPAPSTEGKNPRQYSTYLASRPREWENNAIQMMIKLARETGCRTHIVHLSSADAIPLIAEARSQGVPITAETCPHYLTLAAEEIRDGATTFKCAPPIRERENRERLWQGLTRGDVDFIVSDHSPCTPHLKHLDTGDFGDAWGGISSLQFGLPIIWTQLQKRGLGLKELTHWLCEAPAKFAGLYKTKGSIEIGKDADFVLWHPTESFKLESSMIQYRHSISPYIGQTFKGAVKTTIVRGKKVYDNGEFTHDSYGQLVSRSNS